MIEIRPILKSEFRELLSLWIKYHKIVSKTDDEILVTDYLLSVLNRKNSIVLGIFKDKKLIGFTIGYEVSDEVFYWEGIYCEIKYYVNKLVKFSEDFIKDRYKFWMSEANTDEGFRLLSKIAKRITEKTFLKNIFEKHF